MIREMTYTQFLTWVADYTLRADEAKKANLGRRAEARVEQLMKGRR